MVKHMVKLCCSLFCCAGQPHTVHRCCQPRRARGVDPQAWPSTRLQVRCSEADLLLLLPHLIAARLWPAAAVELTRLQLHLRPEHTHVRKNVLSPAMLECVSCTCCHEYSTAIMEGVAFGTELHLENVI
jgi:hypothetical protein